MSDNFQLNSLEIVEGKPLKVNVSVPNTRLFVGNIPKSKTREDIANEFDKLAGKCFGPLSNKNWRASGKSLSFSLVSVEFDGLPLSSESSFGLYFFKCPELLTV